MIVVTGGAGFIGSCLVRSLNEKGIEEILVVDNLKSGEKWKNLVGKKISDLITKEEFFDILVTEEDYFQGGIEAVFHMGACSSTTEKDADYLMKNNFLYSKVLAEYCLDNEIRFIYASSAATYGKGEKGYDDNELHDLRPLNGYGFSKYLFDLWVYQNNLLDKVTGFKFFNVFGPNEYHKGDMASMVYKAYNQVTETGSVSLFRSNDEKYADGGQMRDFIYVNDVCEVMFKAFEEPSLNGIYNLGTGKARSWNDLINAVFDAVGRERKINYIDMPERLKTQYQNFTEADMKKLAQAGIAHDFMPLEDAVSDYVKEYLTKDWQYK